MGWRIRQLQALWALGPWRWREQLCRLHALQAFSEALLQMGLPIHILLNNAGKCVISRMAF